MPTYNYRCNSCETTFESFHSMNAEPVKECATEGCSGDVEKLIGAGSGILFKGTGFYETDYKAKKSD